MFPRSERRAAPRLAAAAPGRCRALGGSHQPREVSRCELRISRARVVAPWPVAYGERMRTEVDQPLRNFTSQAWEHGTSWTRCQSGPPVLMLGKLALALLLAVPALVALTVVLGVVLVRVGGSPRRARAAVTSGTASPEWQAYRSRLSLTS